MRWPYLAFGTILAAGLFTGCEPTGGTGGSPHGMNPYGTGPFDSHGNYVEALADNPAKSKKYQPANDEPPPDSIPLPPGGAYTDPADHTTSKHKKKSTDKTVAAAEKETTEVATQPKHSASSSKNKHKETASVDQGEEIPAKPRHKASSSHNVEAEDQPKTSKHATTASADTVPPKKAKHKETASVDQGEEIAAKPKHKTSSSHNTETAATNTTAPKKTKPANASGASSSHYTVRSGDSLDRIARHHHTSVQALKTANGLTGDMIHPGNVLVIPPKN